MTRSARQIVLALVALVSAALCALVLANRDLLRDPQPPRDLAGMARWLATHPADWRTAGAISDAALDSSLPQRFALWRSAYAHAKRLAPPRTIANEAFVRAGLFHWYELGPQDRALVLTATAPLMRERTFFERMLVPLWELTRDLPWLRRVSPDTVNARDALRSLAISRGQFDGYRALREDVRRANQQAFDAQRDYADPAALLSFLPQRLEKADEPLVRDILTELDRRPFEAEQMSSRIETLVDYAVRHDIQPLAGILPLLGSRTQLLRDVTRARAALDLNDVALATRIEQTSGVLGAAEWGPYYLDRARFEARRRDATAAEGYLRRAALGGVTVPFLSAGEEVARILGMDTEGYRTQLLARAAQPRVWVGACSLDELCTTATTAEYVAGGTVHLELTPVQSDETPPYVEVYIDDARAAEGEVRDARKFDIAVTPGLHEIEVRLVNARTRNGIQRRVRLS